MHLLPSSVIETCHPRRALVLTTVALALVMTIFAAFGSTRAYAACANPVACENALTGDAPADWNVKAAGDSSIQGFATQMSVTPGQTEQLVSIQEIRSLWLRVTES